MKRLCLIALGALGLCIGHNAVAKHDGWYVNELTRQYATPHLRWLNGADKLRTLFIVPRAGGRDVVELAQRMELDFTPFVTYNNYAISISSVYESALTGTSEFEKAQEIRDKAQKKFDLIVLGNGPFEQMPADAQFALLNQVKDGTGLLLINRKLKYRKLFENPLPEPAFVKDIVTPSGGKTTFQAYKFGKGRVLCVNFSGRKSGFTPYLSPDMRYRAQYENIMLLLMRAMQWTAGADLPAMRAVRQDDSLRITAPGECEYRLRDEFNNIRGNGRISGGRNIPLELADGKYFCDLLLPGKSASSSAFVIDKRANRISLKLERESVARHSPVKGRVILDKAAAPGSSLRIELADSPYARIWQRRDITVPGGAKEVKFTLDTRAVPTMAGVVRAVLSGDGKECATADGEVFFNDWTLPGYYQVAFGDASTPSLAGQLVNGLGMNLVLTHLDPQSARNLTLLNERLVPYVTRIIIGKDKQGGCQQMVISSAGRKQLKELGSDHNFYRPEFKKIWEQQIVDRMDQLVRYSPVLYSLGDENGLDISAGYGPSDLVSFRDFLRRKYRNIANLNREWESSHATFDAVPHRAQSESLREGKYAEWYDHTAYMEQMFADQHHFSAEVIKRSDPKAQVGLEGTFGGHDFEQLMEKLDWWGPYTNALEDEVLRSLYPDVPRFLWSGYHGERSADRYPNIGIFLLKGSVNGNGWYSTDCDYAHNIFAVDQSFSYPKMFMDELQRMRYGIGDLLVNNKMADSGIGIYWSHISNRAPAVDARCVPPGSGISPLIRFCYRNGIGFEFVTGRTAERLKNVKILFLFGISALSDKEAAAIRDFVRRGGTVVADLSPGVLNEYMCKRDRSVLADLFGDISVKNDGKFDIAPLALPGLKASKALQNAAGPLFCVRKVGKGKAILLNFNFSIVETAAAPETPLSGFIDDILRQAGVDMPYTVDKNVTLRVRSGNGFELIGFVADKQEKVTVTLPKKGFIYECGQGFVAESDRIVADCRPMQLKLFAVFPAKWTMPPLKTAREVRPGAAARIDLSAFPAGRTVVIRMFAPGGDELTTDSRIINTAKTKNVELFFPYNAPHGKYRINVSDAATGLNCNLFTEVK